MLLVSLSRTTYEALTMTSSQPTGRSNGDNSGDGRGGTGFIATPAAPTAASTRSKSDSTLKSTTTMNETILDLLSQGGVSLPAADPSKKDDISRLMFRLEFWLGLPEAVDRIMDDEDVDEDEDAISISMEDVAPFAPSFYQTLETLLIQVWNPDQEATGFVQKQYMEVNHSADDPTKVSLYNLVLPIRLTRLLRYWMELNVMGRETVDVKNSGYCGGDDRTGCLESLSTQLLQNATCETTVLSSSNSTHKLFPLFRALFAHVEQLPILQSHMNLYTLSLMRNGSGRSGQALADPTSRLRQLQIWEDVTAKLNQEWDRHIDDLEFIVGEWYDLGSTEMRRQSRAHLGSVWSHFVGSLVGGANTGLGIGGPGMKMENTSSAAIGMTLKVLRRILLGIPSPTDAQKSLPKAYEHLLFHHLLPLHRPNSMVLWRDQTSLLDLYHEPLVQCIAILLQKQPLWTVMVIVGLMEPDVWDKGRNTPKSVLLLHEIDTYLGCLPEPIEGGEFGDAFPTLLRTLASCMASENSRLAQRALPFIKNKTLQKLIELNPDQSFDILLPFLLRAEPSWNQTVRKMTYNVLSTLQKINKDRFIRAGDRCLSMAHPLPSPDLTNLQHKKGNNKRATLGESVEMLPTDYTIKSAMGGWRPPSSAGMHVSPLATGTMAPSASRPRGGNPPLAVTGVAPWAQGPNKMSGVPGAKENPPLGVTGVAPWTMKKTGTRTKGGIVVEEAQEPSPSSSIVSPNLSGVLAYMDRIKPAEEEEGVSPWSKAQMEESPTLLPDLKFHDLVFGHDLGKGAFGSVRYARLIDRARTRSHWSEYAVKIISTGKILELGYGPSVQREIAVLRMLSHPGIARLISSFRFHDGVYLVLEYASNGDLHSLLKKNGSLDHDSARFVVGEVIAALASIHELGLVYGDLKPENIVITETGHIKLTDFGGTRPISEKAKIMLADSARNLLREMRDGDWKLKKDKKAQFDMGDNNDIDREKSDDNYDDNDPASDNRIEGTTAYLPPEVVLGSFPTPSADSWALGCVLYQCLTGRPPMLEEDDAKTKSKIVSFDVKNTLTDDETVLFGDSHASHVETAARDLIVQLLDRTAVRRPSMLQVADHNFFGDAGVSVFSLYKGAAHPLDVGGVQPVADAKWSRRQLSTIWAPQPQKYDISLDQGVEDSRATAMGLNKLGPINEREEATAFFSKSRILPSIQSAAQVVPLPPRSRIAEER